MRRSGLSRKFNIATRIKKYKWVDQVKKTFGSGQRPCSISKVKKKTFIWNQAPKPPTECWVTLPMMLKVQFIPFHHIFGWSLSLPPENWNAVIIENFGIIAEHLFIRRDFFSSVYTEYRSQRMLEMWFEISFNFYPSHYEWIINTLSFWRHFMRKENSFN